MRMRRALRYILVGLDTFIGFTAVGGGIAMLAGVIQMPIEWLAPTPFTSYMIPALLLTAVGLTGLVGAVVTTTQGLEAQVASSFITGAILTGFVVVEMVLLGYISFLQPFMLVVGLLTMSLAALLWFVSEHAVARKPGEQYGW